MAKQTFLNFTNEKKDKKIRNAKIEISKVPLKDDIIST